MKAREFARRREQVMSIAGPEAVVILPAAPVRLRNRDTAYPYRQCSDFYYLTGFREPEAVLVLLPEREQGEMILFCRERDPEQELWDGPRAGLEGARRDFRMDDAFPIEDIDEILPNLMEGRARIFTTLGRDKDFDQRLIHWANHARAHVPRGETVPGEFVSLDHHLHELRLHKNRQEQAALARSARLAAGAHRRAMRACRPGMHEYELAAEIVHEFHAAGAEPSYEPIVGGGANACVLHYVRNRDPLRSGDLVLVDAGAELDYYASDITRSFPVDGRFSGEQRAVYEIVLEAQKQAIEVVRPGVAWDRPHAVATRVITEGLLELGLLEGEMAGLLEAGAFRAFYPHKTGHWIGLDVHDVGDYRVHGQARELERGMAFTVEPGIYVRPDAPVPERWRGIGVRVEDDVVVTQDGCRVLSADAPKEIDDIEAWMRA